MVEIISLDDLYWALKTRVLTPDEMQLVRDNQQKWNGDDIPGFDSRLLDIKHNRSIEFDNILANQAQLQILAAFNKDVTDECG